DRIPNVFIRQGTVHLVATIDAVGAVARGLGSHDAFVLLSEGHDFSLRRRRAAIDSLRPSAATRNWQGRRTRWPMSWPLASAASLPQSPLHRRRTWLYAWWARIDAWIAG